MINKNTLQIVLLQLLLLTIACNKTEKFTIEKGKVGHITKQTTIKELKTIFKKDSIVSHLSEGALGDNYFQEDDEYKIYEKGGKHLLTIIPKQQLDSSSTVKSIEIHDKRFKTKTNLNVNATFSEINATNNINKVESTFSTAILFINDFNITVSIAKDELGIKEFDTQKVSLEQIPDLAKIKSLVVWFD